MSNGVAALLGTSNRFLTKDNSVGTNVTFVRCLQLVRLVRDTQPGYRFAAPCVARRNGVAVPAPQTRRRTRYQISRARPCGRTLSSHPTMGELPAANLIEGIRADTFRIQEDFTMRAQKTQR